MTRPGVVGSLRPQMASSDARPAESGAPDPLAFPSDLSFEQTLQRLETIVEELEGGELALERALSMFEEGVKLSRCCAEQLSAAEQRVETLVREGGEWKARPFEPPDEEGA